jgi:putative transposase
MDDDLSSRPRSRHSRWAQFRFSVIGELLAAPPRRGELGAELRRLSEKAWRHPITGEALHISVPTIERWMYTARRARTDPVQALRQKLRKDAGQHPSLSPTIRTLLRAQHQAHPSWSARLHADNLAALAAEHGLEALPSDSTVRRYLRAQGLERKPRARSPRSPGAERAARRRDEREVRSYEAEHVHGLWHADFHHASFELYAGRRPYRPKLLGVIDDHSRLVCHLQWMHDETAESFVHGLTQALLRRGMPRALMTDQGPAMMADEVTQGLLRLGIVHRPTLPYSPHQNAKQEVFWARLEERLMAMLEGVAPLTLDFLNRATLAWVEREYHLSLHRELCTTPLDRFASAPRVGRDSPPPETLRRAFRIDVARTPRRSDGTLLLQGQRFEIPSRLRHLRTVTVRYARWDLTSAEIVDPRTDTSLAQLAPLDKARNADARRARHAALTTSRPQDPQPPAKALPALLRKLLAELDASGQPAPYLPMPERASDDEVETTSTSEKEEDHG